MVNSSSISLRKVLNGSSENNREIVSSGLQKWRMVVKRWPEDNTSYKYICCEGACPGAPSTAHQNKSGWNELMFNVDVDWQEMNPLNLSESVFLQIAQNMRQSLPPRFKLGCSNVPRPVSEPCDSRKVSTITIAGAGSLEVNGQYL